MRTPADDTARLVLADILQESENSTERAEGVFIWAGVTASRFHDERVVDDPLFYTAQEQISRFMATGLPARWGGRVGRRTEPIDAG